MSLVVVSPVGITQVGNGDDRNRRMRLHALLGELITDVIDFFGLRESGGRKPHRRHEAGDTKQAAEPMRSHRSMITKTNAPIWVRYETNNNLVARGNHQVVQSEFESLV